ncbi:MAG: indolepyruvate ferredoxin oxidoreductase [Thermoprotei archaeon]|nr:MAG: indolepyruvate ferredoxin oxidoreductase [Thermoprotei archaeon]
MGVVKMVLNVVVVGVGGQGLLLLSRLIGESVIASNTDINVSVAETHGLSQRGGSVIVHIRMGKEVFAPLIPRGEANIMLALEMLEAARYLDYLSRNAIVAVNDKVIRPIALKGSLPSKEELLSALKSKFSNVYVIKASETALALNAPLSANMALLGFIEYILEVKGIIDINMVKEVIKGVGRGRVREANLKLFNYGYNVARNLVRDDIINKLPY